MKETKTIIDLMSFVCPHLKQIIMIKSLKHLSYANYLSLHNMLFKYVTCNFKTKRTIDNVMNKTVFIPFDFNVTQQLSICKFHHQQHISSLISFIRSCLLGLV